MALTERDDQPTWGDKLAEGALLGLCVWAAEVAALSVGVLGIGGVDVLDALRDDLAWWGGAYLVVGAVVGLLRHAPTGRFGVAGAWLVLLVLGRSGVVPKLAHAVLVLVAAAVWAGLVRLGRQRVAMVPAVGALGLLVVGAWPREEPVVDGQISAKPDIVLLVVDTLRRDRTGFGGHSRKTRVMDRLAREGLSFTNARSTSSWTLPAHASLFTGLVPSEHGTHAGNPHLDEAIETLAEALDARGYRTVGLSANAWVSGGTGLDRGFDQFTFLGDDGLASQLLLALLTRPPQDLGGRAITDHALGAVVAAARAEQPLFLFANYLEAHEPLGTLPASARSRFEDVDPERGRVWMRDMARFWCACEDGEVAGELVCADGLYRASEARVAQTSEAYDAGVAYIDGLLGELVYALDHNGRDTLIVLTSDHGEHLGEAGRLGHMVWIDAPLLDIPLVIRGRGVPKGLVDEAPIDLSELAPWLLARVDGRPPPPRKLVATSEVHPHPAATVAQWETLFGCDFAPAATPRRAVLGETEVVRDGERVWIRGEARPPTAAEVDRVSAPFAGEGTGVDAATRRALEAIGYVE